MGVIEEKPWKGRKKHRDRDMKNRKTEGDNMGKKKVQLDPPNEIS